MSNAVPLSAFTHFENDNGAARDHPPGPISGHHRFVQPGAERRAGQTRSPQSTRCRKTCTCPRACRRVFRAQRRRSRIRYPMNRLLILAALVAVYIVLGVLYESFIHPITILSTLPSAGVGALLALILFHQDLSVVAIIGIVLLIGIVKKNGIMMVDFALEGERQHGKNATDAIYEACLLRFRPIMMTTMAALLAGCRSRLEQVSALSCAGRWASPWSADCC